MFRTAKHEVGSSQLVMASSWLHLCGTEFQVRYEDLPDRNVIDPKNVSSSTEFFFSELNYQTMKTENPSFWNELHGLKICLHLNFRVGIPRSPPFLRHCARQTIVH